VHYPREFVSKVRSDPFMSFCILIIILTISGAFSKAEAQPEARPRNVVALEHLIDSLELGARVHLCKIVRHEAAKTSDPNTERGVVFLDVIDTVRGAARDNLVLPYSFAPRNATYKSGTDIWPDLSNLGVSNLLCVVVPNGRDLTAYLDTDQTFVEAASSVIPIKDNNDASVLTIKRLCEIYDLKDATQMAKELRMAIGDKQQMVVDFALQAVAMKLSKAIPDEAIQIVQYRASQYTGRTESIEEAQRFISFIESKTGVVEPWKPMNCFFARCMIVLAQSQSIEIKKAATKGLAHIITRLNHIEGFSLKSELSAREIGLIRKTVNDLKREYVSKSGFSELQLVDTWLLQVYDFTANTNGIVIEASLDGGIWPKSEVHLFDDETSVRIAVSLMGQEVCFTVDTGSELTILDKLYEDRLGAPLRTTAASTTVSHSAAFTVFQAPEFKIGNEPFKLSSVGSLDLSGLRMVAGVQFDGILGMDAMEKQVVCFDLDKGTFAILQEIPHQLTQKALAVPLRRVGARAYAVQARLNGVGSINLLLDSGDNGFISLNQHDWELVFGGRKSARSFHLVGADGQPTETQVARLDEVFVSTNRYTNVIVRLVPNPASPSSIGFGFIRQHRAVCDFPNEMMYLTPGKKFGEMVDYNMSGLSLVKANDKVVVYSVRTESPAFHSGVRAGDEILSINGKAATSLELKSIRQMLGTKPGDPISIQGERASKKLDFSFKLRREI
jgi:predicted aspartyl protease